MTGRKRQAGVELEAADLPVVGWREWVRLPDLCRPYIKAKIDTGARTSALHAHDMLIYTENGVEMVRFTIHPRQRNEEKAITITAPVIDHRHVRSSHGKTTFRPVILTTLELLGQRLPIELTLVGRHSMKFRMLIGRQALRGRFLVNTGESYLSGRLPRRTPAAREQSNTNIGEES
ncbi:ATP-dependent zinc protease [bacterium]|nr:ATP-dependent zinc protease [bacterium]